MLQISISTLLMAVITTSLFVIILTFLLRNTELMVRAGYKLLALFVVFVFLRFLLPFEFSFVRNIYLPLFISRILSKLHQIRFALGEYTISLWQIFQCIWGIGFVIGMALYIRVYLKVRYRIILYGKVITDQEPYSSLIERICREQGRKNRFTVLEMPGLDVPVLFGIFSPCILIPENFDIPETTMYYLLRHEASHHFHHDLVLKFFIRLITLVYWWNPFCILLNRQTDIILEMRIDDALTRTDVKTTGEYLQCLIDVSDRLADHSPQLGDLTMSLFPAERSDLKKRFIMLTSNQEKRKIPLNIVLCLITVSLYILSYTFIFEVYYDLETNPLIIPEQEYNLRVFSNENSYCIDNEDGTYDIYYNNTYLDTTDSLEFYPDITEIYTKENCPY